MDGDQSSQFFSALLLAGACTAQGIHIEVEGHLVSTPYIDLTASVLHRFGVSMTHDEKYQRLHVAGGQTYQAKTYDVEPDASTASYFFAAAAITEGRVRMNGLGRQSVQGDIHFLDVLEKMGCTVFWGDDAVEVLGPKRLQGIDVDMESISDTALTLAAIAPFADSPVTIRGIGHVRRKETDRIAAPVTELRGLGIQVEEYPDHMVIHPGTPQGGKVETYDDHRIAMSFALIGLRVAGITILDPGCTAKTFPDFFDRLQDITN
jgi:3-phosphoshikimate 1-carboxyvinyltransferase